jgi:GGDEF domain-containing protein
MGGDEFVVLCLRLPDHRTAVGIAERIVEALATPFTVGALTISISASVGVTTGSGEDRRN